jgi:hypothetical protein
VVIRFRRWIKATDDGTLEVRLNGRERDALRNLAGELRQMLAEPSDPALRRLFPPGYSDDAVREAGYQMMMGDELRQRHLAAAEALGESADAQRLDPEQATAWLQAINSVRLVLGTRLGIEEDGYEMPISRNDPNLPLWALFDFLGALLNDLVEAMSI